jgi:hypothetical protein
MIPFCDPKMLPFFALFCHNSIDRRFMMGGGMIMIIKNIDLSAFDRVGSDGDEWALSKRQKDAIMSYI